MPRIRAFRGLRARDELAQHVIALPYDVMNTAEARAMVAEEPRSFLRVTRPDAVMAEGADMHSQDAYEVARGELEAMRADGTLVQEDFPSLYLYRQTWRGRTYS